MNDIDLNYICTVISNLSGVPIRVYQKDALVFYHDLIHLPKDPMIVYQDEIWKIQSHVGYYVTQHFNYYGIVNSKDIKIILGPTSQVVNSDQELKELAFRANVDMNDVDDFVSSMKNIVRMPFESVMQILCTINYILNNEKLELKDIAIYDSEQIHLKESLESLQAEQVFSENEIPQDTSSAYEVEQVMLDMIQKGDTLAMKEWLTQAPAVRGGVLAREQLRHIKNTFIVSVTLMSRAAIRGGMRYEDAFALSDAYIQKCELLNTMDSIMNLQYHVALEFTQRVEALRFGENPTKLIIDVMNYVKHHLSDAIKVEDIAQDLYISRPYLSAKFKSDSGVSLTDFILMEKVKEAKRLLRYSSKPTALIGSYLGFSSQSHFSRVFKKFSGMSPLEYRKKYERSTKKQMI